MGLIFKREDKHTFKEWLNNDSKKFCYWTTGVALVFYLFGIFIQIIGWGFNPLMLGIMLVIRH